MKVVNVILAGALLIALIYMAVGVYRNSSSSDDKAATNKGKTNN